MMQSVWLQTPASMLTSRPYAQPMTTYSSPWMMCGLHLCQFQCPQQALAALHQQSHILCALNLVILLSVCNGCRNKFSESDNHVIQHKELNFTSPHRPTCNNLQSLGTPTTIYKRDALS